MTRTLSVWCTTSGSTGFGRGLSTLVFVASLVLGAPMLVEAQAPRSPTPAPGRGGVRVETIARGIEHSWAVAFLPDGRLLATERPGRLRAGSSQPRGQIEDD